MQVGWRDEHESLSVDDEPAPEDGLDVDDGSPETGTSTRPWWQDPPAPVVVLGLVALLAIPLVVALVVVREPRWFSYVDLAQIELRVRDAGSLTHTPATGIAGRIYGYGARGSHPGPISFFALWPIYTLFGADGWALLASSVTLTLTAAGLGIWIGYRRGGLTGAIAVAAVLAMLMRGYGAELLLLPWNPYTPMMWWVLFLLAVWAVLCRDLPFLPVAVVAGTMCAQTHLPYLGLVPVVGGLMTVAVGIELWGKRRDRDTILRLLRWTAGSAVLLGVLWLPPVIQQLANRPGNLAIIVENFRHPWGEQVTPDLATDAWSSHLDIRQLLTTGGRDLGLGYPSYLGNKGAGLVMLVVWATTALVAWRRRQVTTLKLHAVAAVAVAIGLLGMSRIFGPYWPYLTLWAWGTTAIMALALLWTLFAPDGALPPAWRAKTPLGLGAAMSVLVLLFTIDASDTQLPNEKSWKAIGPLVGPTVDALEADPTGCDDRCQYLVTWSYDNMDTVGDGLRMALEQEGFDARALPDAVTAVRKHRIIEPEDADLQIDVAIGAESISELEDDAGAQLVARAQPDGAEPTAVYLIDPTDSD